MALAALALLASALAPVGVRSAYAQGTVPEVGVWLDDTQQGAVEIYICQDRADRLCGRIVWLRDPLNAEGKPKFDRYNPNAAMQGRPICGLSVLGNLAKSSDGSFDNGWIYDPKTGKSYSAAIQLSSANTLTVTGYLGMKFMGKSFTWTRAPDGIQKCTVAAAAPMKAPVAPVAPQQKASTGAASSAQKPQQAPAAKPKTQATATATQQGGAAKTTSQAAAKPQAKTATSASPVLTAPPAPAKKPALQNDTGQ